MSFIHPALLGGLVLVGLPVVLHLIMRQQPKHLVFPAVRFLKLQLRTNQRKLRLRHLLLLALRVLLVALMCLALARPRLFSERFAGLGDDQAAVVVLVLDTSPSMEYAVAGKSRLEDARTRALELLDELGDASRIAVLDTAEPGGEWALSRAAARERVLNLQIRHANRPVTDALDAAFRLLAEPESQETAGDPARPRFVYVFSDRTPASWDAGRVADLKQVGDRLPDPKPKCVYVDLGAEKPADLAIADLEVRPQAVPAGRPVVLAVTVQATGQGYNNELLCRFDGQAEPERKPIDLKPGERQVVTFERRGLAPGYHQAEVALGTADGLPFDNVRFATVLVREPRRVLVVCDDAREGELWQKAINRQGWYQCDLKTTTDPATARLGPADLAAYQAVCLVSVARPGQDLWDKLEAYVRTGGGLAVAPGGRELDRDDYTRSGSAARRLLPGELVKLEASQPGVTLAGFQPQHRLAGRFREWAADLGAVGKEPRAFLYWDAAPAEEATVLARYADADKHPAVLERAGGAAVGRGAVILFTTPLDGRRDPAGNPANNYWSDWFAYATVNEVLRHLTGEAEDAALNHPTGPAVPVPLPLTPRFPSYTVQGPGLTGADTVATRAEGAGELRLTQPRQAGNYAVTGGGREWEAKFSLNVPPEECLLLPRVGADAVEELFGPESVLAPGQNRPLRDALEGQLRQPVELFPWLMLLLLAILAAETVVANKFYRQPAGAEEGS
jgi:hypothetical protein